MQRNIPSYKAIVETLRMAVRGYVIVDTPERRLRPMPWRRILHHLSTLGADELLLVDPSANGMGSDIGVRRVTANGSASALRSTAESAHETIGTVDARAGSRASARFAQRIEMAVRNGECECVACVKRGSQFRALTTRAESPVTPDHRD